MGILDTLNAGSFGEGITLGTDAAGLSIDTVYSTPVDVSEGGAVHWMTDAIEKSTGSTQTRPWWETVAQYGLVRAIDNRFGNPGVSGNMMPGYFAGQNGQTYANPQGRPIPQQRYNAAGYGGGLGDLGGLLPLLLLGFAAAVVVRD